MLTRFLRVFSTGLTAWRLSSNPVQFCLTLALILIAPWLVYIFFGAVIFFILLALGGWLLYRSFKKQTATY